MLDRPLPLTTKLGAPVVLRRLTAGDAESFAAHVVRGGEPLRAHLPWPDVTGTPDEARAWLTPYEQCEDGRVVAAGAWRGDELVGGGVLFHHDSATATVELGTWVVGDAVGAGVASAVCRELIALAHDPLGAHRVTWQCVAENETSLRLARRLGFRHEGTLRQSYVLRDERHDIHVLGLVGDEIERAASRA